VIGVLSLALLAGPAGAWAGDDGPDDPLFDDPEPPLASVRRQGSFGLGLGAGTSTAGISTKYWMNELLAVQAVVGAGYHRSTDPPGSQSASNGWESSFALGADLLFEQPSFAAFDEVELGWGLGPGVGAWVGPDPAVAIAGVVGLEACMTSLPIDVVIEVRPRVYILPDPAFQWFSLSGHARWYF